MLIAWQGTEGGISQSVQAAIKPQNNTQFTFYVLATALLIKQALTKKTNPTALKENKSTQAYTLLEVRSKKADIYIG